MEGGRKGDVGRCQRCEGRVFAAQGGLLEDLKKSGRRRVWGERLVYVPEVIAWARTKEVPQVALAQVVSGDRLSLTYSISYRTGRKPNIEPEIYIPRLCKYLNIEVQNYSSRKAR